MRNPGRPHKRPQPTEEQKRMLALAWRDPFDSMKNPDGYRRNAVVAMASNMLGRRVAEWELKHWFGPRRRKQNG